MRSTDDPDTSVHAAYSGTTNKDRQRPSAGADEQSAASQAAPPNRASLDNHLTSRAPKPGSRRRRNRRSTEPLPAEGPASQHRASPDPKPGPRPAPAGTPPPPATSGFHTSPKPAPNRPEPKPHSPPESRKEPSARRTEGTRPPEQGDGRGLSGSPRNPNHYGEIPIRPDNSTFDATNDRLVCIARHHVIPETFPVQYRRMTASSRLRTVATLGNALLLCDFSHIGPHIWPDQTVASDEPDAAQP